MTAPQPESFHFSVLISSPLSIFSIIFSVFIMIPACIYTTVNYKPHDFIGYITQILSWFILGLMCAFSPLSVALYYLYRRFYNHYQLVAARKKAVTNLTRSIKQKLNLGDVQAEHLSKYTVIFSCSVFKCGKISLDDIDTYFSWLYGSGCVSLNYDQYRPFGMNSILSHKIFIPVSIRSSISDWHLLEVEAHRCGILLTSSSDAPTLASWNTELRTFLPWAKDYVQSEAEEYLEFIVQLASEAYENKQDFPEFIASLAELSFKSDSEYFEDIDKFIDSALHVFAKKCQLEIESPPSDDRPRIIRILRYAHLHDIPRNSRIYAALFPGPGHPNDASYQLCHFIWVNVLMYSTYYEFNLSEEECTYLWAIFFYAVAKHLRNQLFVDQVYSHFCIMIQESLANTSQRFELIPSMFDAYHKIQPVLNNSEIDPRSQSGVSSLWAVAAHWVHCDRPLADNTAKSSFISTMQMVVRQAMRLYNEQRNEAFSVHCIQYSYDESSCSSPDV